MPYPRHCCYNSHQLTNRKTEVLKLLSYGYSSCEIAERLHVSAHTIISHRKNIMDKLEARNSAGLVRRGFELGILKIRAIGEVA